MRRRHCGSVLLPLILLDNYYRNNYNNYSDSLRAIKKLIEEFKEFNVSINSINTYNKDFISELILSKIDLLNNLLNIEEQDIKRYNSLLLEYEKDKALFKRKINELKEKDKE